MPSLIKLADIRCQELDLLKQFFTIHVGKGKPTSNMNATKTFEEERE